MNCNAHRQFKDVYDCHEYVTRHEKAGQLDGTDLRLLTIGVNSIFQQPTNVTNKRVSETSLGNHDTPSVHLVRLITKCIWFVLVPNDKISFGLIWFGLAGQLPNVIWFVLVPTGKILFGLLWFGLAGQLPNAICFGLVPNEKISFGPICFGLAIQLPNGICFGLVLTRIRPNDIGFVLGLNKW